MRDGWDCTSPTVAAPFSDPSIFPVTRVADLRPVVDLCHMRVNEGEHKA